MKIEVINGITFIQCECEKIIKAPAHIKEYIIKYGQFIRELGPFKMNDGFYLKYEGKYIKGNNQEYLLFSTNTLDNDYYYAFLHNLKTNTIKIGIQEIEIETIEIFKDVKAKEINIAFNI